MSNELTEDFLWTSDEFIAATGGRPVGEMPGGVMGVSIDTRTLEAGDAFFAIKGDLSDGHDYVSQAAASGAALAVVSEEKLVALGAMTMPLVVVSDVLAAMQRLGVASRLRSKARIIAVTGSAGKTTTKEMLRTLLSNCGKTHASVASYNNHWGVPLTLARMPRDTQYGVFEIGMNHPGEITPLVKMVRPHVAMITTVVAAHLGMFKNLTEIARAKAEIFNGIEKGGYALINRDNAYYSKLNEWAKDAGVYKTFSFGKKRGAKFAIRDIVATSEGSSVEARISGTNTSLELSLAGEHMVYNLMAAIGGAVLSGADLNQILEGVSAIDAVGGRGEKIIIGEGDDAITLIDESYNANPASMAATIAVLGMHKPGPGGKRIAVLGDMLELGKSADKLHKGLEAPIRHAAIDKVWLAGPHMKMLGDALEPDLVGGYFESAQEMAGPLLDAIRRGDVVMFKASLGTRFGPLVRSVSQGLKAHKKRK